jgi:hypothetical protein
VRERGGGEDDEGDRAGELAPDSGPRLSAAVRDRLPDVRDGLTRVERIVLWQLSELQKERGGRNVPTAQLYGRVVEFVDLSERELSAILARFGGLNTRV